MASITSEKNGRKTIQFVGTDGKRRSIRLGKISAKQALAVKVKVEDLVAAGHARHAPSDETSRWVADLHEVMRDKLASVGLADPMAKSTLAEFIDSYLEKRTDLKPGTKLVLSQTRRTLIEFFGANKNLRGITPGDADEWRLYLVAQELSDNTVRRRCGIAKQFFNFAVRKKLLPSNPFADLKAAVRGNPTKFHFITNEVAQRVLDACPDAEWRLLFALSRYGGLRCPSEHLGLRWVDIDWDKGRMLVHSPKTEHHEGGATRQVPIFPELLSYLREVFEQSEPSEFVITRYRKSNVNLRTQLYKIIRRAGLSPWPKLFHNLRSTRQTELQEQFPAHVVCAWIGNTEAVAKEHYLQLTDEHFERAIQAQKAVQNPVQ